MRPQVVDEHPAKSGRPGMLDVGVLGGMGPAATADFLHRVIVATERQMAETTLSGDQQHLRMIVDCDPTVPERTEGYEDKTHAAREPLIAMAQRLERWGGQLLVMPCNSAHLYYKEICDAVQVEMIDWPGVAASEAMRAHPGTVGLLSTRGTVKGLLYAKPFMAAQRDLWAPEPDSDAQNLVTSAIDLIKGKAQPSTLEKTALGEATEALVAAMALCAEAGAASVLLGCTELSVIAARDAPGLAGGLPYVDASQVVADHVVDVAWRPPERMLDGFA